MSRRLIRSPALNRSSAPAGGMTPPAELFLSLIDSIIQCVMAWFHRVMTIHRPTRRVALAVSLLSLLLLPTPASVPEPAAVGRAFLIAINARPLSRRPVCRSTNQNVTNRWACRHHQAERRQQSPDFRQHADAAADCLFSNRFRPWCCSNAAAGCAGCTTRPV